MTATTLHYSSITIVIMMDREINGLRLVLALLVPKEHKVYKVYRVTKVFRAP